MDDELWFGMWRLGIKASIIVAEANYTWWSVCLGSNLKALLFWSVSLEGKVTLSDV